MRIFFLLSLCQLLAQPIFPQDRQIPSEKPKLVIGIVVSGMRYDYVNRYWDKFGEGGFRRLYSKGTNCKNTHHDYLIIEPGSGAASIATGAYPDVHGIVSDYWYDRLKNRIVYCVDDETAEGVGGKFGEGKFAPTQLQVSSLSDELRIAGKFESKVLSISLDPKIAVLSGGYLANGSYWYDNNSGKWVTSTFYAKSIPDWANEFNKKKIPDIYLSETWETLFPISQYDSSIGDDNEYEKGFEGIKTFPYDLQVLAGKKRREIDYRILKYTPFGNTYTTDFAIASILGEELGSDLTTDWLSLNYAATSYVGELFTSWSVEMEDIYLRLDRELEHLLDFVDKEIGLKNVLVYLTADNASANPPSYLTGRKMPGGYFNYNSALSLLKTYLNVIYGKGEWINFYYAQQIFLNRELIESSKFSLPDFQEKVAGFMVQFDGISNTLTATDLMKNNYTHGNFEKMQKSYNQKRSGDILLNISAGWVEKGADRQYASSFHYDSHVPLVWYGWKVGREEINTKFSITDIAPTIAALLQISGPSSMQGIVIPELFK